MSDRQLSDSVVKAVIHAPADKVNIADWLFHPPDSEYQRCSHAHIADCRMFSISDAITKNGRSKVQVVWDLSAKPLDDTSCEYTNRINAYATDESLALIKEHGITFEQAGLLPDRLSLKTLKRSPFQFWSCTARTTRSSPMLPPGLYPQSC